MCLKIHFRSKLHSLGDNALINRILQHVNVSCPHKLTIHALWLAHQGKLWGVCLWWVQFFIHFYPRPVLAFGYCHSLRLCVCVCVSVCESVCQSLACPWDNSGPVQARITKFGPKMQKTLVKVPIVLGGNWPWPSRSNLTKISEFTPFSAWPDHNSLPIQARITKFGRGGK